MLEGEVVRLFELPQDFGFAQHHRIQSAGDFEQMLQAMRLMVSVKLVGEGFPDIVAVQQESAQRGGGGTRLQRRDGVHFHPVAGGENDPLGGDPRIPERLQGRGNPGLGKGKSLAHSDRRGAMAEPDDDDGH